MTAGLVQKSSLVKVGMPGRAGQYLGLKSDSIGKVIPTKDNMGIRMRAGDVLVVAGKQDGTILSSENRVVEANQYVLISPEFIPAPYRYHVVITFNTALMEWGQVTCPSLIAPGHGDQIKIGFRASKKTDLNQFSHIFELYMLD